MKNSRKLLLALVVLLLAAPFWYAFVLSSKLAGLKPLPETIIPESDSIIDHLLAIDSFQYVVGDRVKIELDTGPWQVTLRTNEDLLPYCMVEVRNDTLFVVNTARALGRDWISATVKAPSLMGLAVVNGGQINCLEESVNFNAEHLDLTVETGNINLAVDSRSLAIRFLGRGNAFLVGSVGRLEVSGSDLSAGSLEAFGLEVDTAYVTGTGVTNYELHIEHHLDADLRNGDGDLAYYGHPTVVKKESGAGRVINANLGRKE